MPKLFVNTFLAIVLLVFFLNGKAQVNLVPNPSFEIHNNCPTGVALINEASPWFQPTWGTSDLFDSCDVAQFVGVPQNFIGFQSARTGRAYCGLFIAYPSFPSPSYREYIEVKLLDSLQPGQKYFVTFYVSLSDSSWYASDDIGVLFSSDTAKSDTSYQLHQAPQIINPSGNFLVNKSGWMKVSGQYIASGGEKFITIGNFKDNVNTDTINTSGGGTISSDYFNAYYYIDDICVSTDSLTCNTSVSIEIYEKKNLIIYPNPANESFCIKLNREAFLTIVDNKGFKVLEQKLSVGNNVINSSSLDSNIYFLEITDNNKITLRNKIIINH